MRPLLSILASLTVFLFLTACSDGTRSATSTQDKTQSKTPETQIEGATPADSSRLSVDWAGTYSGVLPCASCPGIETTITLHGDGQVEHTARYIDERPLPYTQSGKFSWNESGNIVTLDLDDGQSRHYQVGEHRLFHLDQQGRRIEGKLAARYILDQHLRDPRIEDRRWQLTELLGQPIDISGNPNRLFLQLRSEQSRAIGKATCNTFSGFYAIKSGLRIEFADNMAMTLMACQDEDREQEFIETLKTADNYSIGDDGSMTLNRARMAPLARFVEASED